MSRRAPRLRRGTVAAFDEAAGYGTVREDPAVDGAGEWFFHCTAIADGSRRIPEGAEVVFVLAPGHRGRMEARGLRPR